MTDVLAIERLTVRLPANAERPFAVREASLTIAAAEVLCLVGESGSGKSMLAAAAMGLLPDGAEIAEGSVRYAGRELVGLTERERRKLRGSRMAMVFQDPTTSLNPVMRVGAQIAEAFEVHGRLTPRERRVQAVGLLAEAALDDPAAAARAYPFELSGGERQRVMIAMALALRPALLIADEPTSSLDVTTAARILTLLRDLSDRHDMAVLLITHDFGIVTSFGDRVAVMDGGAIVETGTVATVVEAPRAIATRRLLDAVPSTIVPSPGTAGTSGPPESPILTAERLTRTFTVATSLFGKRRVLTAVDDVSFALGRGEALGLVGESGAGKSTVARILVRLVEPDRGVVRLDGTNILELPPPALRAARRRIQMVFQNPYASLDPRVRIADTIAAGAIAAGMPRRQALDEAHLLIARVGLDASAARRLPREFSGGQRQRIAIARALALRPDVLIADEAVSALDVSVQAGILDLLRALMAERAMALLFITHDLRVAAGLCDRVAVMRAGRIVEIGTTAQVFLDPREDYTRKLLDAVPGTRWSGLTRG